jgi:hypothetical protein
MTTESQVYLLHQSDSLYAQYVKPLEKEHIDEYAAVAPDGRLVLAPTLPDVMERAEQALPPGNFLFKVGEVAVDTWRR